MTHKLNTTNEFICEHPNAIEKKYTTVLEEYLILYEDVRITETSDSELENYHSIILENPSRNL